MKHFICLLLGWALLLGQPAQAGDFSPNPSQAGAAPAFPIEKILALAKKVEKTLAAKGAMVGIIGRVGRPPQEMPEGMHYTHAAFAVYSEVTTQDGRQLPAYATYNEYQSDTQPDTSSLVQDYPVDFFASVASLEAGIIIPSPELQQRLLLVITSPVYASLHEPHYSAIANPYTLGKQNCTEFVLDVLIAAIYQTGNIKVIKANEKAYFVAQRVNVNPLKLTLGSMFSSDISLSDHASMPPVTATFETIAAFLKQYDQGTELIYVNAD